MRALTTDELGRMRDTQTVPLPRPAHSERDSDAGYHRAAGQDVCHPGGQCACRLAARDGARAVLGEKTTSVGDWILTLDHAQTIELSDRVIIGARTFDVVG